MNLRVNEMLSFCKQLISSVLSVALIINLSAPLAAQSVRRSQIATAAFEQNIEKALEQENLRVARESTRVNIPNLQLDEDYQRLIRLYNTFLHPTTQGNNSAEQEFKTDFMQQYNDAIEQELARARQQISSYETEMRQQMDSTRTQAIQANVSDALIKAWEEETEQSIKQTISMWRAKVNAWGTQARAEADKKYQEALQQAQTESRHAIREQIEELLAIYHRVPSKAQSYVISISLMILMADGSKTDLFTQAEKELLRKLYIQELQTNTACYKGSDLIGHSCETALNAVSGLGVLGRNEDAQYISEFIDKVLQTPGAAGGLLTGVSALLAMQQYGIVRGIIHTATNKEDESDVDMLSARWWIDNLSTINGKYLGEVSKWAQFPVPGAQAGDEAKSNAWEEVAYMLAEDGSPAALAILQDYGINKCNGYGEEMVSLGTEYDIVCLGIKPFLVGALASGKQGEYSGPAVLAQPGYVIDRNGRSSYVDERQIQEERARRDHMVASARSAAAGLGINIPAYITRKMYLSSMGDLDADSQLLLDKKLYEIFNKQTQGQKNLAPEVRLRAYDKNSAEYRAKQQRQHRADVFRIVGSIADIAILVWCVWDLVHLGVKAVRMGRGIYTAAKMARAGKPVPARLESLWGRLSNLRYAVPERIKGGLGASRANMMQFASVGTLIKPIIPSVVEASLPTAVVTKDMGLALDAGKVKDTLGASRRATRKVGKEVSALQTSLNGAVENARTALVNQKGWQRALTNPDTFYRAQLSREVRKVAHQYSGGDTAVLADFAAWIRNNRSIVAPKELVGIKQAPLLDNMGLVNMGTLRNILSPVLGANVSAETRMELMQALNIAKDQTGLAYTHRGWFSQGVSSALGRNKKVYNTLLSDNILRLLEDDRVLTSLPFMQREKTLLSLAASVRSSRNINVPLDIAKYAGRNYTRARVSYRTVPGALFAPAANGSTRLPLEFLIDGGVKGVSAEGRYQRVVFTEKGGKYFVGLTDGLSKPKNLSNFKIDVPASEMPALIRAAQEAGITVPIEIKLSPYSSTRAFRKAAAMTGENTAGVKSGGNFFSNLWAARRNKTKIWIDEIPVFIRQADGTELAVPILLKADSQLGLAGSHMVLGLDNSLFLLRDGAKVNSSRLFRYSLPKKQITPLANLAGAGVFRKPLRLTVNSGRNKILPLYIATGLSLSSASVGLIAPLETTYKDRVTDLDKTLISLAFPYLPSLFAPALSPFVMRYGALRMVQTALGVVAIGLGATWALGFNGHLDADNPNNLPPLWPLLISGATIGVSSAMSRSGLNVLIDTMGGGGSLLKSMAFKNLGSLLLLAPSFIYGGIKLNSIARNGDNLPEAELQKKLSTPATDFSFAFPVLTLVTLGVLGWVSAARIDTGIGRSTAVLQGEKMKFGAEMVQSWKTIFAPEVLPLATAAFFFTGFEAGAFSKASNQAIKPLYEKSNLVQNSVKGNQKNLISLLTGGTVALMPFITRMVAKPTLRLLSDPLKPGIEYKRMLWLSYGMNTAGGALLLKYGLDDDPKFIDMAAGIGLMGFGTANVTQSLQKLANIKVGSGVTIAKLTKGMPSAAAAQRAAELKTMTMTGFSWSQVGIAAIPLIQSSYVDREVASGIVPQGSAKGPLSSIWIPLGSLGLSFGFAARSIGLKGRLATGLVGGAKLLLDGPQSFNPVPYVTDGIQLYRTTLGNQLDFRVGQYQKHEAEKQEVAEQKAKAAAEEQAKKEKATSETPSQK